MLPKTIELKDRTTDELTAMKLVDHLRRGRRIKVRSQFVENRQRLGQPYDPPSGAVSPDFDPNTNDYLVISVGGGDFAVEGEMNPTVIVNYCR